MNGQAGGAVGSGHGPALLRAEAHSLLVAVGERTQELAQALGDGSAIWRTHGVSPPVWVLRVQVGPHPHLSLQAV